MKDSDLEGKLIKIQERLFTHAYFCTGNKHKAEDLLSDANIKIWKNRKLYREDKNFFGWACRIMDNKFKDNLRKERKQFLIYTDEFPDREDCADNIPYPDIEEVNRVINKLSEGERVLIGFMMKREKMKVIATKLGIPVNTAKSRIRNLRRKICKVFGWKKYCIAIVLCCSCL